MSAKSNKKDILDYHSQGRPGKIEVIPTKPHRTQRDLAIAYSPGVAEPCLEIQNNPSDAYKYTAKGNLVAVISNGTAVLGLGDIGALASKPVMEGKGLLFKIFADIDVFDIEVNEKDPEKFIQVVKAIAPTFGGINLEDIKAPEAFEIEQRLKAELDIPVMHDDQHGTAIISGAGLLNALEVQGKSIDQAKLVINGAGASAVSCTRLFKLLGAKPENIIMLDSKGVIHASRTDLDTQKKEFITNRNVQTLEQAIQGADVFVGLSKGNILSVDMVKSMAPNPIVFALANPTPEIAYDLAISAREDIIVATGRSDHPNQVNNVLGFPYIFRGALDVRATGINEEMKLAAVKAIAELTKKPVPEIVNLAYNQSNITFGKHYIIPKPFDPRLIHTVAPAVARAAMESGVAQIKITDWDAYEGELKNRLGLENNFMKFLTLKAKSDPKRIIFAEADNIKVLKAAQIIKDEGIGIPILLGTRSIINQLIEENSLRLDDCEMLDVYQEHDLREQFADKFYKKRHRKGISKKDAARLMRDRNYFGLMMLEEGMGDAFISGISRNYPETLRPALQVIGKKAERKVVAGMYMMLTKKGPFFFSDTSVNVDPSAEEIADIAVATAEAVKKFNIRPVAALLSYSNFGSNPGKIPNKLQEALEILHNQYPGLMVDGEMQANFAVNATLLKQNFEFSDLVNQNVNTLIFPNLAAGNIAYKLIQEFGAAEAVGPILLGTKKPVHVLQLDCSIREVVNMATIAVIDAQISNH